MAISILEQEYDIESTTILDLSHKKLTFLFESVYMLTNLQYLYLHYNNLSCIPESISMLTKLRYLYLYNNNLTHIRVDKKLCFLSFPVVMNRKSKTFFYTCRT